MVREVSSRIHHVWRRRWNGKHYAICEQCSYSVLLEEIWSEDRGASDNTVIKFYGKGWPGWLRSEFDPVEKYGTISFYGDQPESEPTWQK